MALIEPWIDRDEWQVLYRAPHATLTHWESYDREDDAMAKARELAAIDGMELVQVDHVRVHYRRDRLQALGSVVL